jgi:beta-N-acetylhexosaminidase
MAALVAGIVVGAVTGNGDDERPATSGGDAPPPARPRQETEPVDRLTLAQQVGRMVILRFHGTSPPGYVRRVLAERRAAGAILFRDNVVDPAQLERLTISLREASPDLEPLICVDQEGGEVRIVPWAAPERTAPEQAAAGTVRADAVAAGRDLRAAGIGVTLAPVADVPSVDGAALAGRSFSPDPDEAAAAVAESVRGWREAGVATTAKHFPGLGGATVNTDDGPATVRTPVARDLVPFRAAIAEAVPLVMLSHASYPELDSRRIASQSRAIVTGLLRRRLGFQGVIVTDSLEAGAVLARSGVDEAAERSIRAGADLILMTGSASWNDVFPRLLAEARADPAFRERVRDGAARVLALKRALVR